MDLDDQPPASISGDYSQYEARLLRDAELSIGSRVDPFPEGKTADRISDAAVSGDLRLVTPRTPLGRLVFDTTATNRWRNYLNRQLVIGGEDRLRGYPTRFFQGKDLLAMNLEFRSRPIELASCHFGGAVFYDVGGAASGLDDLDVGHSLGVGLRAVFPHLDRAVLRFDVGFPIADARVDPVSFFFTFGQAFEAAGIPPPLGP